MADNMGLNQVKEGVALQGFSNKTGISGNIQLVLRSTLSSKAGTEGVMAPEPVGYSSNSQRAQETHGFIVNVSFGILFELYNIIWPINLTH